MRFAFLILYLLFLCVPHANAQQNYTDTPFAPWMEEETSRLSATATTSNETLKPQKLSLSQIEKVIRPSHQAPKQQDIFSANLDQITEEPSRLEELYATRVIDEPEQFGYDLFKRTDNEYTTEQSLPAGQALDHYILSAGDELNIIVRGQINSRERHRINSEGLLVVDQLPPIMAAGRPFKEVVDELKSETLSLHNTQIFVSLSAVRQVSVLVIGNVNKPGRKTLTAFHSILDALNAAGGITKTGSLRRIKLVRNGKSHYIDLYHLLMNSSASAQSDRLLQDGDRLIVPPIGPTVAVSGHVKRPGIYEIRPREKLSLSQILNLGGGLLSPGQNRFMRLEYTKDGTETVQDIHDVKQRIFGDSLAIVMCLSSPRVFKREPVRSPFPVIQGKRETMI
ncbi:MAG: SLBB domain-containing protein [Alphaproteobacteria bacterium]|nr:SLBB domain-containing protein [Alphaproteobacteria bacterium]